MLRVWASFKPDHICYEVSPNRVSSCGKNILIRGAWARVYSSRVQRDSILKKALNINCFIKISIKNDLTSISTLFLLFVYNLKNMGLFVRQVGWYINSKYPDSGSVHDESPINLGSLNLINSVFWGNQNSPTRTWFVGIFFIILWSKGFILTRGKLLNRSNLSFKDNCYVMV